MSEYWRTIDFRPLPPGWRLVFLLRLTGTSVADMPGVVIQEECERDRDTYEDIVVEADGADRRRRVMAASWDGTEVDVVTEPGDFWMVLGPSESEPGASEEAQERERRRKEEADLVAIRARLAAKKAEAGQA